MRLTKENIYQLANLKVNKGNLSFRISIWLLVNVMQILQNLAKVNPRMNFKLALNNFTVLEVLKSPILHTVKSISGTFTLKNMYSFEILGDKTKQNWKE